LPKERGEKVVFCRGFIYETRFVEGSDKLSPLLLIPSLKGRG